MTRIPDYPNYTTPQPNDVLVIDDVANDTTKKVTVENLVKSTEIEPSQWKNPYCFRAYASGSTTLTDNTTVKILFATESYDYGNDFASSTYTAPVAGVYHFEAVIHYATAIATLVSASTYIYKNGASAITGPDFNVTGNAPVYYVSGDLLLAANDTIEIHHFQNSAGSEATLTGSDKTWFCGHLIHEV